MKQRKYESPRDVFSSFTVVVHASITIPYKHFCVQQTQPYGGPPCSAPLSHPVDEGRLASMGRLSSGHPLEGRWCYVCRDSYFPFQQGLASDVHFLVHFASRFCVYFIFDTTRSLVIPGGVGKKYRFGICILTCLTR